mmetsp:Transcript_21449/g.35903  ORF Transcript_21449/g.35903 Transcript_21449/m.35903 type:complete len:206 (+) Transcript_21449:238-855(+)|eukprot:CAMPEP_0174979796 /NCGR_PEP_ID=MMETSP0004_2-20121128/14994_1 /TAXON_ID=420556 /ORGANISM="Ochromonas sp., Strain CCMP1393" /LENGTH=205 /DNA_ID=CAMNT_0016231391 /DNA_START=226 /DNA_END=843 /DNA_ORIENTATION=-
MEFLVEDMKQLPVVTELRLKELRLMDSSSRSNTVRLNDEGNKILDELSELAKKDPDFDEEPIRTKFQAHMARRSEALNGLDGQMQKIQKLYDLVDGRITFLDTCTKDIEHLMPQITGQRGTGNRKKKKRKAVGGEAMASDEVFLDTAPAYDPNEPVFCTCRQISYGNMIACEHENCPIEWFHFPCVGLKSEPEEPWFCAQCRKSS